MTLRVAPEVLAVKVPFLSIQPLVENAVRHGIEPRTLPGTVEIAVARRNGSLDISVRDDGVGLKEDGPIQDGVGLANTRARLRQLYGARQSMSVGGAEGGGVRVLLTLPFRTDHP